MKFFSNSDSLYIEPRESLQYFFSYSSNLLEYITSMCLSLLFVGYVVIWIIKAPKRFKFEVNYLFTNCLEFMCVHECYRKILYMFDVNILQIKELFYFADSKARVYLLILLLLLFLCRRNRNRTPCSYKYSQI